MGLSSHPGNVQMTEVRCHIDYTPADVKHAFAANFEQYYKVRLMLLVGAICFSAVACIPAYRNLCLPSVVVFTVSVLYLWWKRPKADKVYEELEKSVDISLDESGIFLSSPESELKTVWSDFRTWCKNDRVLIVSIKDDKFVILPNRCFSNEQWQTVQANISKNVEQRVSHPLPTRLSLRGWIVLLVGSLIYFLWSIRSAFH